MPSFHFRTAELGDAADITTLVNYVYRGESGLRAWTGEAHLIDGQRTDVRAIKEALSNPRVKIVLAFKSDKLVGCVMIRAEMQKCYLGMLTVDVDLQKAGLGTSLLREAENTARGKLMCTDMFMYVISLRTELIDWYSRRGYELTEKRAPFPYGDERFGIPKRDDLEFVIMAKDLT
jgi:ribosomal protein S18 acetylase RimI-like enzyme